MISLYDFLDRETANTHQIEITAIDLSSTEPRTSTMTVDIDVTDVNDNSPSCPMVYNLDILPPYTTNVALTTLPCVDIDDGINAQLTYTIVSGNTNGDIVVGDDGEISLMQSPTSDIYYIQMLVKDKGAFTLSTPMNLNIIVQPEPAFTLLPATETFEENQAIGISVYLIETNIPFGRAKYQITDGARGLFIIAPDTGIISQLDDIDRESTESVNMTISVEDLLTKLTTFSSLHIDIEDVNDNSPAFEMPLYTVTVTENTAVKTEVLVVKAKDADSGVNSEIAYALAAIGDGVFTINSTGSILVNLEVDREVHTEQTLDVICTDGGSPALTGTTQIHITIAGVNEHAPVITNLPDKFWLNVDDEINTIVIEVMATDEDQGESMEVTFSILSGNENALFSLNSVTGIMKTASALTNRNGTYELTVKAADAGAPPLSDTAVITIKVLGAEVVPDVHYSFQTFEGLPIESFIGNITIDSGIHGTTPNVIYSITKGNSEGHIEVLGNGTLVNNVILNRETVDEYNIVVYVDDLDDSTLSYFDTVHIAIMDINDNSPVPEHFSYLVNVVENTPIGVTLLIISATDDDAGVNADLSFTLSTSDAAIQSTFMVLPPGILTVKSAPDYETKSAYDFNILLQDNGLPPLSAVIHIHVDVVDVEDTIPDITEPPRPSLFFSIECYTGAVVGDLVLALSRMSFNLHGQDVTSVKYVAETINSVFRVDKLSGDITVASTYGLVTGASYVMWVFATASFSSGSDDTVLALIRIDIFSEAILLTHAISENELLAKR